ncbi:MAG: hypothetical protein IPO68_00025 [Chitinophagaceae bacterium]|nr:hypothetical protein [Chitinophagaceae bacterium]
MRDPVQPTIRQDKRIAIGDIAFYQSNSEYPPTADNFRTPMLQGNAATAIPV